MKPELIPDLLDQLQRQPTSECVRNPYRSTAAVENLRAYLSLLCGYPYSGHLLVEAYPLSWNCIRTGIPNSSEEILGSGVHPFLSKLLPSLKLSGDSAEQLSSISWKAFAKRKTVPAFWYIFPYHSHAPENKEEGRFPTDRELSGSLALLHLAVQVLSPHTIVTFEGEAEAIVRSEFPYLKHRTFPPRAEGVQRFFANCESLGIP